jgi:hypothetical protein
MKTLLAVIVLAILTTGCGGTNESFRAEAQQSLKDIATDTFENASADKLVSVAKSAQQQAFAKQILALAGSFITQRSFERSLATVPAAVTPAVLQSRYDLAAVLREGEKADVSCLLALQINLLKNDLSEPFDCHEALK